MSQLNPDKIKEIRTKLQLSQAQLAALLGLGVATLNRYENGAEPTPAHAGLLQGLADPITLARLLKGKESSLGSEVHARLLYYTSTQVSQAGLSRLEDLYSQEKDSALNGGRAFSANRLKQLVLFFTKNGEWKTKLNKLLFYADFLSFKELRKSLTGTKYVVGYYGPIPDNHEFIYASLLESGALQAKEEFKNESGDPVEKLVTREGLRLDVFNSKEQVLIKFVFDFFNEMSAKEIADYSHDEAAYRAHSLGQAISYKFAQRLRLHIDLLAKNPVETTNSLWNAIQNALQDVSTDDFNKLPTDGATNLDHYLYGTPKNKR